MKNLILLPALMFCLAADLRAADDCTKSDDACKPQIQKLTPFMAELKRAEKPPELKQGAVKETALKQGTVKEAALKQGAAKEPALKQSEPKPQFESHFGPAAAEPPAQTEALSKPAWLLVIGALLAGLYYFLKEGEGKRKRV